MKNLKRTTLLINLSVEEADQIRAAAKKQDRTISAYVLRAVVNRMKIEDEVERHVDNKEFFEGTYLDRLRRQR